MRIKKKILGDSFKQYIFLSANTFSEGKNNVITDKNIDELIKQYEPEILAFFSDIADLIIKEQTDKLQDEIPTVKKFIF